MPVKVTRSGKMPDNLQRYQRALPAALFAAGSVVVTRVQRIFILFKPAGWATGDTVRSMTVSPPYYDGTYMRVKIGPTTKYAWYVEHGRKPGKMPPIQAILDWVEVKKIAGTYTRMGTKLGGYPRYGRRGGRSRQEIENRQAAFLIARKIGREGTRPHPYLKVGFRQSRDAALMVFRRVLAQGILFGG